MKILFLSALFLGTALSIYGLDIRINTTPSIPLGIYRLSRENTDITKGNIVLFCLNHKYKKIAKARKYLSAGKCSYSLSPIGKHVVASYPDKVKISSDGIHVNGHLIKSTRPLAHDKDGRKLIHAEIHKQLEQNEFIVASSKTDSFDSRYYGIVKRKDIQGKLKEVLII